MNHAARERLLVVGHGLAAVRALERITERWPGRFAITVLGDEPVGGYNRVLLTAWLAGECGAHDLPLHDAGWYAQRGIAVRHDAATHIDRTARVVQCASGARHAYEHLLLATGSQPALPDMPGIALPGVHGFRTLADVRGWLHAPTHPTLIVGGGVLGLEAADGLRRRGAEVTVLHGHAHLMERQLDAELAGWVQRHLERLGVRFVLGDRCAEVLGEAAATGVRTHSGRVLAARRIVFTTGIRPDARLAHAAGLPCARGVCVDARMRTADPHVSAVGECAEQGGTCHGLVAPLYEQIDAWARDFDAPAADASCATPPPAQMLQTRLKLPGIDLFVAGDLAPAPDVACLHYRDAVAGVLRELRLRQDRLVGARLLGDTGDAALLVQLMRSGEPVAERRHELSFGGLAA